ncbi:MFS transporter [Leptolyngbya iicbica]|uniref:MFS transporter n=2 Tax=Cyanophyceae TaxID=3028117 RepID=A0A4Q7E2M0_9CYAN|nr:MFS transporter [Leptolyngbya sp. LK]RZM76670.1 MFS transporter [Leptolyngbya sp. LK]
MTASSAATPSFETQLDESPITRTMWLLWLLSAGLIALDGFDFFIIGVAIPFLKQDFGLDAVAIGAVATAAVAGSLVGSLTLGPITDRIGRQLMLIVDVAIFVIATMGTALAWNATSLIAFRFLVGVGIGADYPISVSYITENMPARWRGRMVIGAFTFQAVGALLGAVTGLVTIAVFRMLYPDTSAMAIQYAWRWMLGVGVLLAIAVAIVRLSFSLESPRYYISRGEYEEASIAATQLLETDITITPDTEPPISTESPTFGALFNQMHRRSTLLASLPWFLQDIATYGVGIFTPAIIAMLAFADETDFMVREMGSAKGSAVVDVFLILGFIGAIVLVEKLGRIRLQVAGFMGMAVGLSILAAASRLPAGSQGEIGLVVTGFFVFNLMMNAGPNATTFLLSGEVFPTSIRATGAGFAAAFAKAGAVLGTFVLPVLQRSLGAPTLLLGLAGCCVLAAGLTLLYRIDTAGQSLEAIGATEVMPEPLVPK